MFEGLVAGILKQYLGQFVLGLDADQLDISVFSGTLSLKNLDISPSALENAGIKQPITIKAGTLGKLEISGLKNMRLLPPIELKKRDFTSMPHTLTPPNKYCNWIIIITLIE